MLRNIKNSIKSCAHPINDHLSEKIENIKEVVVEPEKIQSLDRDQVIL